MSDYSNPDHDESKLHYWHEDGFWRCAVPRDDFATQLGFDWKHYGLIGRGKTPKAALEDWRKWKRAADFVASIY